MDYKDYAGARDMTWNVLLDCKVDKLPVRVSDVCRKLGIVVRSYSQGYSIIKEYGLKDRIRGNDGFLFKLEDHPPIIFYRQDCTPGRCRFTIAHELGHLMLGHTGALINREPCSRDNPVEREANIFAARLLAPACVLWGLDAIFTPQIEMLCNISHQAAEFRSERMKKLYLRDRQYMENRGYSCFLQNPLEEKVYLQFLPFIKQKREERTL